MALPLDSIVTIFIFLIGLPAILLQTLPAEIRRTVLQERKQEVVIFTVGPIVLASVVVGVGAYLTYPGQVLSAPERALAQSRAEVLWLLLTTLLLLIAGTAALVFTERWRRVSLIRSLERSARRGIVQRGRPVEEILRTLIELGIQSQRGQDKDLVIEALARLSRETQAREGYDGAQLEDVIAGLEDIFTAGSQGGTADNFATSGDLLLNLILDSRERANSDDIKSAVQAASLLGRLSLRHEQSHIQLKFLDALSFAGEGSDIGYATWASRAIFEIGSEALEAEYMLVAMTALSKLEMIVTDHAPVRGDLASDFIGLVAHCFNKRETGRDYSQRFIEQAGELFVKPLEEVVFEARQACMHTARFRTGDYLARMLAEFRQSAHAPSAHAPSRYAPSSHAPSRYAPSSHGPGAHTASAHVHGPEAIPEEDR